MVRSAPYGGQPLGEARAAVMQPTADPAVTDSHRSAQPNDGAIGNPDGQISGIGTEANRCSQYVPRGNTAAAPSCQRARIVIFLDECAIAQQRFDACPLVRCRDPGPQVAPGLAARGPVVPGLREHGAAAQHTTTSTLPVRGAVELERAYAVAQIGEHDVSRPQLGRDRQRDLVRFGHGAMRAEEVQRPRRTQRAAVEQRGEAIDPGPVMDPLDQVIEDRIGSGVG